MFPAMSSVWKSIVGLSKGEQLSKIEKVCEEEHLSGNSEKVDEFGFVVVEGQGSPGKCAKRTLQEADADNVSQKKSLLEEQDLVTKKELDFHEEALQGVEFRLSTWLSLQDSKLIAPLFQDNTNELNYDFSLEERVLQEWRDIHSLPVKDGD